MTKGIIALLAIWGYLVFKALQHPWIGVIAYASFAVLCPPWNWRWGLPQYDYQKFLAGATLLGWVLTGFRRQGLTTSIHWVTYATAGYVALGFLSSLQSLNPPKSAIYMDITYKIALMCCVGIFVLNQSRHLAIFAWALMICQGWNAWNVNQVYFDRGFINVRYFTWNYLDNNTYSISTVPIMAVSFAILMTAEKNWKRLIAGFIFILQVHQIMLLESRGTMLGCIVLAAAGIFFMPKNKATIGLVSICLILGGILAGPSVVEEFNSSFKTDGERDSSAESRFLLWKAGAAIMRAYPIQGVGPWAGELMVPRYYEGDLAGMTAKALHNLFFEVGTGCGIPGLICYLLIFFIPFFLHLRLWFSFRKELPNWMSMINLSFLCGIPGYWAASMFSSGALIESPYLLVLLASAAIPVYYNELEDPDDAHSESSDESDNEWVEETATIRL